MSNRRVDKIHLWVPFIRRGAGGEAGRWTLSTLRRVRHVAPLFAMLLLAGCAQPACTLAGQQRMTFVKLYFGRDVAGQGAVTDAQWSRFAADVIGRAFPDGFTVFDATGQWRNPATGVVGREATKVVEIAAPVSVDVRAGIAAVTDAYKQQFHQLAVGVVSSEVCAAF